MKTYTEMLPHIEGHDYETHFWNAIRGKQGHKAHLVNGIDTATGAFTLTPKGQDKYMAAIKQEGLFRSLATDIQIYDHAYNIKTVEGPDDYASMKEVVKRRYQRAIEEKAPLPDLLITDGGKGQMSAVKEVIDELGLNIPIAGLAKDGKHRTSELLYGYPPQTIGLKQNTPLFRLLTQIQDEVHRFAITFHRDKRSKRQIASALDEITGIGEKTKSTLLKEFKSVKRIREASAEELAAVVGEAKAKIIQTYFSEK